MRYSPKFMSHSRIRNEFQQGGVVKEKEVGDDTSEMESLLQEISKEFSNWMDPRE